MSWREDEAKTRNVSVELLLERGWSETFPQVISSKGIRSGDPRQRWGCDRILTTRSGRSVLVEEKVRFREYCGDLLLEVEHVFDDGRDSEPGWIRKPMQSEYIGFLWVPTRRFEVYPWLQLQSWYAKHSKDHSLPRISSRGNNEGYSTSSMLVPRSVLESECLSVIEWKED